VLTVNSAGLNRQEGETQERGSSGVCVLPTSDRPEDSHSTVSKFSSSSPPPPPIDVIAIDVTPQRLPASEDVPSHRDDIEEERQSNTSDSEYRHSPLGGAMPESDDSSVGAGEFVFP